jgi:signal transduction histidine kinase
MLEHNRNRTHHEFLPHGTSLRVKIEILIVCSVAVAFCCAWAMSKIGLSGWISLPIVLIFFSVIGYFFSRHLTQSLIAVRDAAQAMAQGEYHTRLQQTSTDEVGELVVSFNEMANDLEHEDQMRKDLIANVSHELRTPVAAMMAQAENMADHVIQPTPANLEVIVTQTHKLSDLIAFLLDLSRMEAGAASLHISRFNFKDFIDETLEPLKIADAPHDHSISEHIPHDIMLEGDRDRLGQLFTNIVSNALKHSPDRTRVLLEARTDTQRGVLVTNVVNFGSHIAPQDRERIFRRFALGQNHPGTSSGGTGLGLSIARWAAKLHGGTVRVVDDPRGANFQIELPLKHSQQSQQSQQSQHPQHPQQR